MKCASIINSDLPNKLLLFDIETIGSSRRKYDSF